MTFLELFLPILAALCCWTVFVEILGIAGQWWISRRQSTLYADMQEKLARGELPPGIESLGDLDSTVLAQLLGNGQRAPQPTTSGENHNHGAGQYL